MHPRAREHVLTRIEREERHWNNSGNEVASRPNWELTQPLSSGSDKGRRKVGEVKAELRVAKKRRESYVVAINREEGGEM